MGIHRDGLKDESLSDERRNAIPEQAMPWKFKRPKVLTLDLIRRFQLPPCNRDWNVSDLLF